MARKLYNNSNFPCPVDDCLCHYSQNYKLTNHIKAKHPEQENVLPATKRKNAKSTQPNQVAKKQKTNASKGKAKPSTPSKAKGKAKSSATSKAKGKAKASNVDDDQNEAFVDEEDKEAFVDEEDEDAIDDIEPSMENTEVNEPEDFFRTQLNAIYEDPNCAIFGASWEDQKHFEDDDHEYLIRMLNDMLMKSTRANPVPWRGNRIGTDFVPSS